MIKDVIITPVPSHGDKRGILHELFRQDELNPDNVPQMGYLSYTLPGEERGPHEHKYQSDLFYFIDGIYELHLWDNRVDPPTHHQLIVGGLNLVSVIIPPGVVHGYKNIGDSSAFVLNFPNKLYKGVNKEEEVDEIRHEGSSKFVMQSYG